MDRKTAAQQFARIGGVCSIVVSHRKQERRQRGSKIDASSAELLVYGDSLLRNNARIR
jgi:hypothetical protein